MGITDFDPEEAEPTSGRKRSSSSSSRSSDGYKKMPHRHVPPHISDEDYPLKAFETPKFAMVREGDELVWKSWPDTPEVRFNKETEGSRWELVPDEDIVYTIWGKIVYSRIKQTVSEELGADLTRLLNEEPQKALDAIELAERMSKGNSPKIPTSNCEVCGKTFHIEYGDYHIAGSHVVCGSHTVAEMKERDLL